MNRFLEEFIKKGEKAAMKPDPPNPVKEKKGTKTKMADMYSEDSSLADIVENKPSAKKVLEYLKARINTIYTEADD